MRIEEVVGANVRRIREINDITQEEVGRKIGTVLGTEWTRQAVSAAEKGGRSFTARELIALAHVLGTSAGRLLQPPLGVDEVEVSEEFRLTRADLTSRSLPSLDEQKIWEAMLKTLHTLAQASAERAKYDRVETEATRTLFDLVTTAIEGRALAADHSAEA